MENEQAANVDDNQQVTEPLTEETVESPAQGDDSGNSEGENVSAADLFNAHLNEVEKKGSKADDSDQKTDDADSDKAEKSDKPEDKDTQDKEEEKPEDGKQSRFDERINELTAQISEAQKTNDALEQFIMSNPVVRDEFAKAFGEAPQPAGSEQQQNTNQNNQVPDGYVDQYGLEAPEWDFSDSEKVDSRIDWRLENNPKAIQMDDRLSGVEKLLNTLVNNVVQEQTNRAHKALDDAIYAEFPELEGNTDYDVVFRGVLNKHSKELTAADRQDPNKLAALGKKAAAEAKRILGVNKVAEEKPAELPKAKRTHVESASNYSPSKQSQPQTAADYFNAHLKKVEQRQQAV